MCLFWPWLELLSCCVPQLPETCRNGHILTDKSLSFRVRKESGRERTSRYCLICARISTMYQRKKMRDQHKCERCRLALDREGVICKSCCTGQKKRSRKYYQAHRHQLLAEQKERYVKKPMSEKRRKALLRRLDLDSLRLNDWQGIERAMIADALNRLSITV